MPQVREAIHHEGHFNGCFIPLSTSSSPSRHSFQGSSVLDHNSLFGILPHFQLFKLSRKCIFTFCNCEATGSCACLSHPCSLVFSDPLLPQMSALISELKGKLHQAICSLICRCAHTSMRIISFRIAQQTAKEGLDWHFHPRSRTTESRCERHVALGSCPENTLSARATLL